MKVWAGITLSVAIGWATQWHVLSYAGTERLTEVQFVDSLQGWALALKDLYQTTDRGRTWRPERSLEDPEFRGLAVTDSGHIFVSYWRCYAPHWYNWYVWIDERCGGSWRNRYYSYAEEVNWTLRACPFSVFDTAHIWHLGWDALPLRNVSVRTTDGGATWRSFSMFRRAYYDASFTDTATGWAAWDVIGKTTNAGDSWYDLTDDIGARRIQMLDTLNGWVLGAGLLRTTDGGVSWDTVVAHSGLMAMRFCNPRHGVVVGPGGVILHTTDAGVTWLQDTVGSSLDLYAVWMVDSVHAWAAGDSGVVLGMGDWALPGVEEHARRLAQQFELTAVRPSPCRGTLWLECRGGAGPVVVYDGCGRPVERVHCRSSRAEKLDLRDLPDGVYFARAASSPGPGVRFVLLR